MMKFLKDENGQGMVEYGLIIALVAIVAIVGLKVLGPKISSMFENAGAELDTAAGSGGSGT